MRTYEEWKELLASAEKDKKTMQNNLELSEMLIDWAKQKMKELECTSTSQPAELKDTSTS